MSRGTRGRAATELLIRCLTQDGEPPAASSGLSDWREIVDRAMEQNLGPLLLERLGRSSVRAGVPADQWKRLLVAFAGTAARNTVIYREVRTVLVLLRDSGIPVVVLKGAYLAEAVYGDVALRPMCDVDLLVREADLGRAQAVLLDMGGVHRQFEDIESGCKRKRHLPQIVIGRLAAEIHWTIAAPSGPVKVDVEGLWSRARPATIAGVEVLALSPEDLLLHLCLHFSYSDHLLGLLPFCDIAETIARFKGDVDWSGLAARSRGWGASRYVGLALHLARSIWGVAVPDDALEQLVPGGLDQRVFEAARQAVLAQTGYGQWMPFFGAAHATTLEDKAKLSWQRVFLSRDEMAATYPAFHNSHYLPLYYVRRAGHVVTSYMTHTLRRARLMAASPERETTAALVRWLTGKS